MLTSVALGNFSQLFSHAFYRRVPPERAPFLYPLSGLARNIKDLGNAARQTILGE